MGILGKLTGIGKTDISEDNYVSIWKDLVNSILPVDAILRDAGLNQQATALANKDVFRQLDSNPDEAKEIECTNAYREHIQYRWTPLDNDFKSHKSSQMEDLRYQTLKASRAYGETLACYTEFKVLEIAWVRNNAPSLEDLIVKKIKDGTQWDVLAQEGVETVINLLRNLAQQNRALYSKLTNGEDPADMFRTPLYSHIPPDIKHNAFSMVGARPGFIAYFP